MATTELYLDSRLGINIGGQASGRYFLLHEPIVAPPGGQISVQLVSATVPLTHWALHDGNNDLHLVYANSTEQSISLLQGNRSIDLIILKLNESLMHGWVAAYDETTNLVTFTGGTVGFEIGPNTTCQTPLGVEIGDVSGLDISGPSPVVSLTGWNGVDISGTQCFFVNSNLAVQNSSLLLSNSAGVLGRIPITRAPNDIERWVNSSGFVSATSSSYISFLYIELLDDLCQNAIEFHGGHWSITLLITTTPTPSAITSFTPYSNNDGPIPMGQEAPLR
jgi:hypothetical protein